MEAALATLVTGVGDCEGDDGGEDVGWSDEEEGLYFGVAECFDERGDEGCYGAGGGLGYDDEAGKRSVSSWMLTLSIEQQEEREPDSKLGSWPLLAQTMPKLGET